MGQKPSKPSMEEVLRYAKPQVLKFICHFASDAPYEHKEEIEQCAYMRLIEAYPKIDAEQGWKSYVYNHCRGAVLDFLKFGKGFQEEKWSIMKEEVHGNRHVTKLRERIHLVSDDADVDLDQILGIHGAFLAPLTDGEVDIDWDLVARMSAIDEELHAFAKWLRGFHIEEIAPIFGVSRARVGQLIAAFVARFDDPLCANDYWFLQSLYALGLLRHFGMSHEDQSDVFGFQIGWTLKKVDLDSEVYYDPEKHSQLSFFDAV